jgi:hypothetical protein
MDKASVRWRKVPTLAHGSQLTVIGVCCEIMSDNRLSIDVRSVILPTAPPPLPLSTVTDSETRAKKQLKFSAKAAPRRAPKCAQLTLPSKIIAALDAANLLGCATNWQLPPFTDKLTDYRIKQQLKNIRPPRPPFLRQMTMAIQTLQGHPLGQRGNARLPAEPWMRSRSLQTGS